jgi:hypothetical protein
MRFAASELTGAGHTQGSVALRLSELLFIEAVRNYSQTDGQRHGDWLKGFTDQYVGQALALIHTRSGLLGQFNLSQGKSACLAARS